VLKAFKADKGSSDKAVAEMEKEMQKASKVGHALSNHFDGRAVDIGTKELTKMQKEQLVKALTQNPDTRVMVEAPKEHLKEAHSIADGNPHASVGQAQTEHVHVGFFNEMSLIAPDTAEFPLSLYTEEFFKNDPLIDMDQFNREAPSEDYVEFFDDSWRVTVSPKTRYTNFHAVGGAYYDNSFKGYVLRIQSEDDPNYQIIIPSYEAVCKLAVIDKKRGLAKEYKAVVPDWIEVTVNKFHHYDLWKD